MLQNFNTFMIEITFKKLLKGKKLCVWRFGSIEYFVSQFKVNFIEKNTLWVSLSIFSSYNVDNYFFFINPKACQVKNNQFDIFRFLYNKKSIQTHTIQIKYNIIYSKKLKWMKHILNHVEKHRNALLNSYIFYKSNSCFEFINQLKF